MQEQSKQKWAERLLHGGVVLGVMVFLVGEAVVSVAGGWRTKSVRNFQVADPQVAAGEWKIEIQEDLPCAVDSKGVPYIQVVLPREKGGPVSIECTRMEVRVR